VQSAEEFAKEMQKKVGLTKISRVPSLKLKKNSSGSRYYRRRRNEVKKWL